jgi:hypothetical protein
MALCGIMKRPFQQPTPRVPISISAAVAWAQVEKNA